MRRIDDENIELEAMRALQYEGTRAEIAQNFREQGNEMARSKRWRDGKEYYTKGLAALKQPQSKPPTVTDNQAPTILDPDSETKKEEEIEEACYINRALCNLELRMQCPYCLRFWDTANSISKKTTAPAPSTAPRPFSSTPITSKPSTAPPSLSSPFTNSPKPATHVRVG